MQLLILFWNKIKINNSVATKYSGLSRLMRNHFLFQIRTCLILLSLHFKSQFIRNVFFVQADTVKKDRNKLRICSFLKESDFSYAKTEATVFFGYRIASQLHPTVVVDELWRWCYFATKWFHFMRLTFQTLNHCAFK